MKYSLVAGTALALIGFAVAADDPKPQPTTTAGQARTVGAGQPWYDQAQGEAKSFEGVLGYNPGTGHIGLPGRFHAFRLSWLADGAFISRPIHTNGQDAM